MKKLSKKQKLIGGMAIIIVAVMLAIVITTNIISNNNQVASEGYSATTANAGSSLISNYILNGITIGGITGKMDVLDTSDATATPEDILWGETAYVDGEKITGTKVVTVAQGKESQKVFGENTILIDDYGNGVKVPAGFKITEDSATAVTGGVVIEDSTAGDENTKESQFVWIPVGNVITDSNGSTTTITLGRYTFNNIDGSTTTVSSLYTEDTAESHNSSYRNVIAKDINDFIEKANSSGGYYIGRYEAGDAYATNSARTGTSSVSNPNNPITCKSGVYPYTYISQADASNLCQNMYSSSNFESDLINSYAWDTAIVFIQEFSGDTDYSGQYSLRKTLAKCGEATSGTNNDEKCNIYDMAGNTMEWSTETGSNTSTRCVSRGGYYSGNTGYFTGRSLRQKWDRQQLHFGSPYFIFVALNACQRCTYEAD